MKKFIPEYLLILSLSALLVWTINIVVDYCNDDSTEQLISRIRAKDKLKREYLISHGVDSSIVDQVDIVFVLPQDSIKFINSK